MPLVSIAVSAFRQPDFLNEAIRSVMRQSYCNTEIIVVDDGSGPQYSNRYELPKSARLIIHPQRRSTAAINRNTAIRVARGKYIAFLDQDDIWLPDKLTRQIEYMEQCSDAVLVFNHYRRVDENLHETGKQHRPWMIGKDPLAQLIRRNIIHCPSQVVMRCSAFEKTGLFDETIRGAADWEMWIRAAAAGTLISDDTVLTLYRQHANQWSRQSLMMVEGSVRVMEKTSQWAVKQRPDLATLLKSRHGRWMRELARIQMSIPEERYAAFDTLRQSIRIWPYAVRPYVMMLKALRYRHVRNATPLL